MDSEPRTKFYLSQTELAKKQIELAKKQKEFIDLQKKDLLENKKDRESIKQFTFVLAFGVIASIFFNLFNIFIQFEQSGSSHVMIISAIFIFIFLFFIRFLFHIFPMSRKIWSYIRNNLFVVFLITIFLLFLFCLLLTVPQFPLTK